MGFLIKALSCCFSLEVLGNAQVPSVCAVLGLDSTQCLPFGSDPLWGHLQPGLRSPYSHPQSSHTINLASSKALFLLCDWYETNSSSPGR